MGEATTPGSSEFPQAIGRVARRELALNGFTTFDQLTWVAAKDLSKIHGVGPKAVRILDEALRERGKAFLDGSAPGSRTVPRGLARRTRIHPSFAAFGEHVPRG